MGIFGKIREALNSTPEIKVITFDATWESGWDTLKTEAARTSRQFDCMVSFPDGLMAEIDSVIRSHQPSDRVPYSGDKVALPVVGESFHQQALKTFFEGRGEDELNWHSGFLLPEMANPYDKTAVAVYVISNDIHAANDQTPAEKQLVHAGYLDKDYAKKYHKKILNELKKNHYVALLVKVTGGYQAKPNYGIFVYSMTSEINFA